MDAHNLTVDDVRRQLLPVFEKHGILRAVLFGSVARGEPTKHSDVDLILVQRTDKRFFDRYEGLQADLCNSLPQAAIEALIYTPEELERVSDRKFISTALREGAIIYECEREQTGS